MNPISDLLNRIRNAQAVFHPTVEIPFSQMKFEICQILEKEGFIGRVEKRGKKLKKTLELVLKYNEKEPVISGLKLISKPGQRAYAETKKLRTSHGRYGIAIVSTSRGLMTSKEARKQRIGGEIICEVW